MSIKETLGLRSHREDPKIFWFSLTLLCLLLALAGFLLSLLHLPGLPGLALRASGGLFLSWAFLCAVLTEAWNHRKKAPSDRAQIQTESGLLLLTAALVLPDRLLRLHPAAVPSLPVVLAGVALYAAARTAGPVLRRKGRFSTREIFLILCCGVLACGVFLSFFDLWSAVSAARSV